MGEAITLRLDLALRSIAHLPRYTIFGHAASYHRHKNQYHFPGHPEMEAFVNPSFPFDLNEGYKKKEEKAEESSSAPSIQPILFALKHSSLLSINVHFITFRNNLNKILNTPYNLQSKWDIGVKRFSHPYFGYAIGLHVIHHEQEQTDQQKRMSYWGRRFEQECTSIDSVQEGNENEYCSLVLSQLDRFRLIVAAEIDCFEGSGPLCPQHFIELKTNRILNPKTKRSFFQHKLRSCWIQSMLAGVPLIKFGFRDDDGIVRRLQSYKTAEIPQMAKEQGANWDPSACLRFSSSVLSFVYDNTKHEKSYILSYDPATSLLSLKQTAVDAFDADFDYTNINPVEQESTNCSCTIVHDCAK